VVKTKLLLLSVLLIILLPFSYALTTLEVSEGELVKLKVSSVDADKDKVKYHFSKPLNNKGEWQTGFSDAGTYTINVTADDGTEEVTQQVLLVVKNVNQAPKINVSNIEVNEGETAKISADASDIDNDSVKITYEAPFDANGEWKTGFYDAGEYEIKVSASDKYNKTTEKTVNVKVNDVNQAPVVSIKPSDKIEIQETETAIIEIYAQDPDGDKLTYAWYKNGEVISEDSEFALVTDYNSSGIYTFIATVYDKETKVEVPIEVTIKNKNREPDVNITDLIMINEGDTLDLNLAAKDEDEQPISYTISDPIGNDQIWETTYEDAGEYNIEIKADDGESVTTTKIKVVVADVDRAPQVSDVAVDVNEGDELTIQLGATDPDGDKINYELVNGPEGMELNGNKITWVPGYDEVKIKYNWISKILFKYNLVWITHTKSKLVNATVSAKGKDKSDNITLNITVWNTNRAPVIKQISNVEINETDSLKINVEAYDPDDDPINIYFSGAAQSDTLKTNYNSAGDYIQNVVAFDGADEVNTTFEITVKNKNRAPKLVTKEVLFAESMKTKAKLDAYDPDGDNVTITITSSPNGSEQKENYLVWEPGYDVVNHNATKWFDKMKAAIFGYSTNLAGEAVLDDGKTKVNASFTIIVEDANRPPVIEKMKKVEVLENQTLNIPINATDPDNDTLVFKFKGKIAPGDTMSFDQAGNYNVTVIASDGEWERVQIVPVTVYHTNRAPEIQEITAKAAEGKKVTLLLQASDPDKDTFSFGIEEGPVNATIDGNTLTWTPGYDVVSHSTEEKTAVITVKIKVTDIGNLSSVGTVKIEVQDVNRAPIVLSQSPVAEFTTMAGNLVNFTISASDPDGDKLSYSWIAGPFESYNTNSSTHIRMFTKGGIKELKAIASDGKDSTEAKWKFAVNVPYVPEPVDTTTTTTTTLPMPVPPKTVVVKEIVVMTPVQRYVIEG
jgi:hypothetical protein